MTARWDRLPLDAKVVKPRRKPQRYGAWRCEGVHGCGAVIESNYAEAERHADGHGSARLAFLLSERATMPEPEGGL